jgi:hypothetical protein
LPDNRLLAEPIGPFHPDEIFAVFCSGGRYRGHGRRSRGTGERKVRRLNKELGRVPVTLKAVVFKLMSALISAS